MYNAQLRQLRIQAQRLLMEDRNFLHTNPKNSHNSLYKPEYRIYARLFSTIAPRRNYDDKTLGNNFHQAMDYTQANVELLPECNPSPDENYFLKFYHHNSFEAQSWKKAGRKSDIPVCTMSCGYSSGWCEESFGLPLTTVELECEAAGAEHCTFIMASPEKIKEYLTANQKGKTTEQFDVPVFFEKKYAEDRLRASLEQRETLLQEGHHRVKNNLQIVSSCLDRKSTRL